ncbi:hypothetical protein [Dankookia sp. GCM10030260]|uniref:hypothetical protein n=1 Tax=Dankookia sp. GCM10030260 TaxID=3273390 RepID=UPI0036D3D2FC
MLGASCGIAGMLVVTHGSLPSRLSPARLWSTTSIAAPAIEANRAPDALGASLARSTAEAGQRVLRAAATPAGRAACEVAIADADSAAYRAAQDARGRQGNPQDVQLVLTAEDGYLAAARLCLREARPICQAAPRRTDGCDQVVGVTEAELVSTRALRAGRGN